MNSLVPPVDRPTLRLTHPAIFGLLALIFQCAATPMGSVEQSVKGSWPDGPCQPLLGERVQTDKQPHPAGEAVVGLSCPTSQGPIILRDTVVVRANRSSKKVWRVKPGWMRIMARRDGELVTAKVTVKIDDYDVVTRAANAKFRIPAGRYRVEVRPDEGPEVIERPNLRVSSSVRSHDVDFAPGRLSVRVSANGARAGGVVRVRRAGEKADVKRGEAKENIELPPGPYTIRVELEDSADFAFLERDVWVRPKTTTRESVEFKRGRLAVKVVEDNKAKPLVVRVFREGAGEFFTHFESPGAISLEPGRYAIEIPGEQGELRRNGLVVQARGTNTVNIDVSRAHLTVIAKKNGEIMKKAEITVRKAGGGAAAGVLTEKKAGFHYRLLPGRYEVQAILPDGTEQVTAPFSLNYTDRETKTLEFKKLRVQLTAFRDGRAVGNAVILVFKRGASEAIQQSGSGGSIELEPGTYDLRAIAGPETAWRQGVRIEREGAYQVHFSGDNDDEDAPLPEGDGELPAGDEG